MEIKALLLTLMFVCFNPFLSMADDASSIVEEVFSRYRSAVYEHEIMEIITSGGHKHDVDKYTAFGDKLEDRITVKFADEKTGIFIEFNGGMTKHYYRTGDRTRLIGFKENDYVLETDLTQEDVERLFREDTSLYDYKLISSVNGLRQIEAIPHDGVETSYSRRILYIDVNYAVRKIDYFYAQEQLSEKTYVLLKTLENIEVGIDANGRWRPTITKIDNNAGGTKSWTSIVVKERSFEDEVVESAFSTSFLESDRRQP